MKLTLGPILFDWKREDVIRFYNEVADMPVDRVYLGEVVCVRKKGLNIKDIESIAERLIDAGKEVALSTLAVVSNEDDLRLVRDIAGLPFSVEANDMSVFNILADQDPQHTKDVIAGPHITTYNIPSIEFLKGIGVKRVVFPVELPRDSIEHTVRHTDIETEVFAHGRVPLAFSWRCYTSRAHGLNKGNCRYDCRRYPDGILIRALEGEPIFTVNGTSILSASIYSLIEFVEDLESIGVDAIRVSPQYEGTDRVVDIFRRRLSGEMDGEEGLSRIREITQGLCNGWYLGMEGKGYYSPDMVAGLDRAISPMGR